MGKSLCKHKAKPSGVDYTINRLNGIAYIRFVNDLAVDDILVIKTKSATVKNPKWCL